MLKSPSPNLDEIREILADIRRDGQRASEVIRRLRSLLKGTAFESRKIDLDETVNEVFAFLSALASVRHIALSTSLSPLILRIEGDPIQIQQVILNLIVNGMDAMADTPVGKRRTVGRTALSGGGFAEVSISDSSPGIPSDGLGRVFDPFFTTRAGAGAVFRLSLPLAAAHWE
jgi:signal transduction histidine kinase